MLSCGQIINKEVLQRNRNNLVVHAGALPKGKGWSPLTWQILERLEPKIQQGNVTKFERLKPEQGDWSNAMSLDEIFDRIRMLYVESYPPAFIRVGSYKLEYTRASRKTDPVIADVKIRKVD